MSLPRLEWSEVLDKPMVLAPVVEGLRHALNSRVLRGFSSRKKTPASSLVAWWIDGHR